MQIRRAEATDAAGIGLVNVESWRAAYRGAIADEVLDRLDPQEQALEWAKYLESPDTPDDRLWVAEDSQQILAYARTGPARPEDLDPNLIGEVYGFYISPQRWGSGIGRILLDHCVGDLAARGWVEAVLEVVETNERARRFYERNGWRLSPASAGTFQGAAQVRYRRWLS